MGDSGPPKPYKPQSLLELISRPTLDHLLTGFRETLRGGVVLYCRDEQGDITRIDPSEKAGEKSRFWSELCTRFRANEEGEKICCAAETRVAAGWLMRPLRDPAPYFCEPLGLTDMAAQVVVDEEPLAVVLMGQRLPRDKTKAEEILHKICAKPSQLREKLEGGYEVDCERDSDDSQQTNLYDDSELKVLLDGLKEFARIIADISTNVAHRQVQIRQREFSDYWNRRLSDARPKSLNAWQRSLQECLESFRKFVVVDVERIGVFAGHREDRRIHYALTAMNSAKWWQWRSFSVFDDDLGGPQQYSPRTLSAPSTRSHAIGSSLSLNLPRRKHYYLYPFAHGGVQTDVDVFSLVAIQTTFALSGETQRFCQDFFDAVCRRDAVMRLFMRQQAMYEEFESHVIDIRHDMKTSVQHVVHNIDRAIRERATADTKQGKKQIDIIKRSVRDHASGVDRLMSPRIRATERRLESVDVFAVLREQTELWTATAERKTISIDTEGLPDDEAYLVCERGELARGLAALLDNAIKYSYADHTVCVSAVDENGRARIEISNYGIGIPPAKLARIRDREVRAHVHDKVRRRGGSGLGLAIASHVFEDLLGGQLDVKSEPAGESAKSAEEYHKYVTTVIIHLPVDSKEK